MKNFNFINSIPPKTQKEFNTWYKISTIILLSCFVLMAIISITKVIKISKLKREIAQIKQASNINDQNIISNQIESTQAQDLEKQVKKLSRWKNPKFMPDLILNDISSTIPDDVLITEISYKYKQPIIIKGQTKSVISLKNFSEKLKETDWAKSNQIVKVEQDSAQGSNLSNFELVIK